MVIGSYREFFGAITGSAGALTGLLFVGMSVAPRRTPAPGLVVIHQVRTAAALLAFTNPLAVSLFGLVPGNNVGYPAAVLGVIGITFTAAGMRSIVSSPATPSQRRRQLGLLILFLMIFGVELAAGVALIKDPRGVEPVQVIGDALAASLLTGIARAWELVGDRDAGIMASIAVLTGHPRSPAGSDEEPVSAVTDPAQASDKPGAERTGDHTSMPPPGR